MLAFIITEDLIKKNARKLMETFYDTIHDEYMLETFDEFKLQRKYYDENITKLYLLILDRKKMKLYKNNKDNTFCKITKDSILGEVLIDKDTVEVKDKDLLLYVEDKIKDKTIEEEFVFEFLSEMDEKLNLDSSLEFECDEDLYCLKKAFLKAYDLFHYSGYNLKD